SVCEDLAHRRFRRCDVGSADGLRRQEAGAGATDHAAVRRQGRGGQSGGGQGRGGQSDRGSSRGGQGDGGQGGGRSSGGRSSGGGQSGGGQGGGRRCRGQEEAPAWWRRASDRTRLRARVM